MRIWIAAPQRTTSLSRSDVLADEATPPTPTPPWRFGHPLRDSTPPHLKDRSVSHNQARCRPQRRNAEPGRGPRLRPLGESPNLRRFNPLRESQSCRRRRETPVCRFRLSPETGRVASRNLAPRHEVSGASTRAIQFNSQEYESENNKWDDCRVSILVRQAEDFVFHSLGGEKSLISFISGQDTAATRTSISALNSIASPRRHRGDSNINPPESSCETDMKTLKVPWLSVSSAPSPKGLNASSKRSQQVLSPP